MCVCVCLCNVHMLVHFSSLCLINWLKCLLVARIGKGFTLSSNNTSLSNLSLCLPFSLDEKKKGICIQCKMKALKVTLK